MRNGIIAEYAAVRNGIIAASPGSLLRNGIIAGTRCRCVIASICPSEFARTKFFIHTRSSITVSFNVSSTAAADRSAYQQRSKNHTDTLTKGGAAALRAAAWFSKSVSRIERRENGPPAKAQPSWSEVCFIQAIPGEEGDDGVLVLADGSLRQVVSCRGINSLLFDPEERDRLAQDLANLANIIDFDIQILVTSKNLPVDEYLSKYQSQVVCKDDFLRWYANYTDRWFRSMQEITYVPQREFYIVVEHQPADTRKLGLMGRWNGKRSHQLHEESLGGLTRNTRVVEEHLRQSGLEPRILNRNELRTLIYQHLNPRLSEKDREVPPSVPGVTESCTLARSGLRIQNDHLWLDGAYVGTQYLDKLPPHSWSGWLIELLTINAEYTFSLFVHACNQERVRKALKRDFNGNFAAATQLGGAPDLQTLESAKDAREALQEMLRTSNKAVDISLYVKTQAKSVQGVKANFDEIARVFSNRGAALNPAPRLQFDCWQSCLPVGVDRLAHVHRVSSTVLGTFWPFFTASCGTPDGVPFAFAVASREPVLLNPFYLGDGKEANNMFVVGTTGAGKSFAVSMLILRLLTLGMRFVIIDKPVDKHGAYRFITELLGPGLCTYVDLGPNSSMMLNPFDLGPAEEDGVPGEPSALKITKLLGLLDLMLAPDGKEELEIDDKSLLGKLLRFTYRECARRQRIPTMHDLHCATRFASSQEKDPIQRKRLTQFGRSLEMYTGDGAFGGLIDGHTNIKLDSHVIVFDTRDINDPRLEKIMAYILTEFIRRRAAQSKSENIRMAAVIDEAATLMRFKAGARLLDDLSRRARHYGLMMVTITQQLKDFFRQAELADSVVKNSHMKILLRQDPSDLDMLKDTLQLTGLERQSLATLGSRKKKMRESSECLLIVGASHGIIRILPSGLDYWVCTSEPTHDIPARRKCIASIKADNPDVGHTDACRRAVFELSFNSPSR